MPVIHPRKQTIQVQDHGAQLVITNAYLIYKNNDLRKTAIKKECMNLLIFPDQLSLIPVHSNYRNTEILQVSNEEIVKFQEK